MKRVEYMNKPNGMLFKELLNRHRNAHHKMVERLGLYYGQPFMLMTLSKSGEISQKELSQMMHNTPASVAVSVKRMEKAGMLKKTADENDLRVNKIALTQEGREMAEKCRESFRFVDEQMTKGFSEEELKTLENFYERMIQNLEELNNQVD